MNISVNPRMIRIVPSNAGARIIVLGGKGAKGETGDPGAGGVTSVNGATGAVMVTPSSIGAATAAQGTDERVPTAVGLASKIHGATNKATLADNDEFSIADSAATYGLKNVLWSYIKGLFCLTGDARLSDARTPTAHNQAWSTITNTPSTFPPVIGTGATDAMAGNTTIPSIAGLIPATVADANSILYAVTDDTPAALALAANTFPARSSTGNILAKSITDAGLAILDDANAAAQLATLGAEPAQTAASQAEAEAGTQAALRSFSPLRIAQAIAALKGTDATRYRYAVTHAVGNVNGSVTADFATSLTNSYTLTGNCTALPAPSNLADGETGLAVFTITGYAMPAAPASGTYKGASWVVTGPTLVRVFYQRIGSVYFISAESPTVVP